MYENGSEYYIAAMKKNAQLVKQKTCDNVNHYGISPGPDVKPHRVINDTWEFRLKRLPKFINLIYKAQYCVSRDIQTAGAEYFETYAPYIVQWFTNHLVLTIIISSNWYTNTGRLHQCL